VAGAGKKLHGGGARSKRRSPAAQVSDAGFGRPPHPLRLVAGQVFYPRHAHGNRRPFTIARVTGATAVCKRLEPPRQKLQVSVARLLATDRNGQGRHYSFQGWLSRRYLTWAQVAAWDDEQAVLVLPEWHPARPVQIAARMLPVDARAPGRWLEVDADLSAPTPARLGLQTLAACVPPPATVCARPRWQTGWEPAPPQTSEQTSVCGDIVLELDTPFQDDTHGHRLFFLRERPNGVRPGGRVYVPGEAQVVGYHTIIGVRPCPNGVVVECALRQQRLAQPVAIPGVRQSGRWRWRWWPREQDDHLGQREPAASGLARSHQDRRPPSSAYPLEHDEQV